MITVRFAGRMPQPMVFSIGQETDSGAEKIRFLLPQLTDDQTAVLNMLLPDGSPEIVTISQGVATVRPSMTEQPGRIRGWVEIVGENAAIIWNSEILYMDVGDLPPIAEHVEQEYPTAFQEALQAAADAMEAAEQTAADREAIAETIQNADAAVARMLEDAAREDRSKVYGVGGAAGQILVKKSTDDYDAAWQDKAIVVNFGSISSLPTAKWVPGSSGDRVVIDSYFSNPAAVKSDLTVTTGGGWVTISGTIDGTTEIKMVLI